MKYKIIDIGNGASAREIVGALAENRTVEHIVSTLEYADTKKDLVQDIYMQLLEDPKTVELYLKKELQYYIVGIARNSVLSKNSRYYNKYKKFTNLNNPDAKVEIFETED